MDLKKRHRELKEDEDEDEGLLASERAMAAHFVVIAASQIGRAHV